MATGTVVYVPFNGPNVYQVGQGFPSTTVIQPPGMVQYVPCGEPQLASPSNPPEQTSQVRPLQKFLKVEAKTLGAIQIMIGLIHIGFALFYAVFPVVSQMFWSGIFFIASGSVTVSAEKRLTQGLVKCSVGMNITSAVMSLIGIILYIITLATYSLYHYSDYSYQYTSAGTGLCVLLLLFSLLEFCITVATAHFGCQATCCSTNPESVVYVPYTVSGGAMTLPESSATAPPAYDAMYPSKSQ
ncbi:membrane-spanning 4-domains subfamily A member 8-like isoform X1 [Sceloporus undulatus]|uniref:membrane-spanning 4-domains subfamily A member 8-like isoform X1 n=1 Tax=Sceloporus undulatus TaxID=8520 RepID=UPI001C4CFA6F|nr:membrane-spanning 4-domains subfamily A member 8-like isoform X1 [Sceloporus undulatus]XP_042302175.1 membrane-spanning 4-domains subfamily A member 8-like isoform X1 [Sceloporus undulatus]